MATGCYYCGRIMTVVGGTRKTRDHVVPVSRGGVNHKINKVDCCIDCNSLKGSKTLAQLIRVVEKKISKGKKVVNYSEIETNRIIKNANYLIENCINVYQKQLFIDKYHWEEYIETGSNLVPKKYYDPMH